MTADASKASSNPDSFSPPQDDARRVGRGALLLTAAKFWFMASAFVIQWGLPRIFGRGVDAEVGKQLYGRFSVVMSFATILNAVVYQGTAQAVARFVGKDPDNAGGVRRAAWKLQALLGGVLFAASFVGAPLIADAMKDATLADPLRWSSFIIPSYAFYSIAMGSFTGTQLFVRQAAVDLTYSTLKVLLTLAGAFAFGSMVTATPARVDGAFAGWALASLIVLVASLRMIPRSTATRVVAMNELVRFQFTTMLLNLFVTAATQIDVQIVQRFTVGAPESVASMVGDYRAAQLFSTIPYSAVVAITFILFPLVSGATDREKLAGYVHQTTRHALFIACAAALCFAAAPARALVLLYEPTYAAGAPMLRVLVCGYVAFSVLFIMTAVTTAMGRPLVSVALMGLLVALQVCLGPLLVGSSGALGAASASAIAMVVALVVGHLRLRALAGSGLAVGAAVRTLFAAAIAGVMVNSLIDSAPLLFARGLLSGLGSGIFAKLVTVATFGVGVMVFILLLFAFRVLDAADRSRFQRVLGRGARRA